MWRGDEDTLVCVNGLYNSIYMIVRVENIYCVLAINKYIEEKKLTLYMIPAVNILKGLY